VCVCVCVCVCVWLPCFGAVHLNSSNTESQNFNVGLWDENCYIVHTFGKKKSNFVVKFNTMFIFICTPQPPVQWGTRGSVYEGKVTGE
jgi:hypothetical protein